MESLLIESLFQTLIYKICISLFLHLQGCIFLLRQYNCLIQYNRLLYYALYIVLCHQIPDNLQCNDDLDCHLFLLGFYYLLPIGMLHDSTGFPSRSTVQRPQLPDSQPLFTEKQLCLRQKSKSTISWSTESIINFPFNFILTSIYMNSFLLNARALMSSH